MNRISASLFIAFCLTSTLAAAPSVSHDLFDKLLQKHVQDGRVDYQAIKRYDKAQLATYLKQLSRVTVSELSKREQLTYDINLYNATMIQAVIDRYHPGYTPAEDGYAVFKAPLVHLTTGTISLNDLENKVIRPTFKDPRIHVALVCGAVSCPPLRDRAYEADTLDKVLDAKMKHWLTAEPSRNRVDRKNHTLKLSPIFNWYADDFGGKSHVAAYVNRYVDGNVSSYAVTFLDYDWTLNEKSPKEVKGR